VLLHRRLALDLAVDAGLLGRAWAAVVDRHEVLRTGFPGGERRMWDTVPAAAGAVAWDEDDAELGERLGGELAALALDPAQPPLARAVLARAGARRELHFCGHRAALDERGMSVLLDDLLGACGALAGGEPPAFAGEPVRPAAGRPSAPLPPGARPAHLAGAPGGSGGPAVAVLRAPLGEAASAALASAGAAAAVLAALRAVLARTAPAVPLAIGLVVDGDPATVAVTAAVLPTDTLGEIAAAARTAVQEAATAPAMGGAGPSLVVLAREARAPAGTRALPGAGIDAGTAVQVAAVAGPDGAALELAYRPAQYDRRTIAVLAADLERMLALTVRAPHLRVGAVPVRSAAAPAMPDPPPAGGEARRTSLVTLRRAGRPHLHLFHPGGGGTAHYQALAASLPPQWTVTASEDPGAGDSIEELAEREVRDLLAEIGVPDVLGGWSMGGALAYEAARRLAGARPALLVLDGLPPVNHGPAPSDRQVMDSFAESLWAGLGLRRFRPVVLDAGDGEAVCALAAGLGRAGERARPEWLLARLDEYRRHLRAGLAYVRDEPVAAPAVLVAAALSEEHVDEWRRRLPGARVQRVDGGHFDVLRPPLVGQVAALARGLATAQSPGSTATS
jgi:thioesterase domain-containing protein